MSKTKVEIQVKPESLITTEKKDDSFVSKQLYWVTVYGHGQ